MKMFRLPLLCLFLIHPINSFQLRPLIQRRKCNCYSLEWCSSAQASKAIVRWKGSKSSVVPRHAFGMSLSYEAAEGSLGGDNDDEDEEDDDEVEDDPYREVAAAEFNDDPKRSKQLGGLVRSSLNNDKGILPTTKDWGEALGKLRERVQDIESGKSQQPSNALFRILSSESPNQAIGKFLVTANPQIVQAMSGAVSSLLGGLSSPAMGMETIVKASGDKLGSLCFQLQMTGYMFRNAEYVMAVKDIMNLAPTSTLQDYRIAFDRIDKDNSGFIEVSEVKALLNEVYEGKSPNYEIEAFLTFFDANRDGKISWEEFKRGLGTAGAREGYGPTATNSLLLPGKKNEEDDDDDDDVPELEPELLGRIEVELEDGKTVKIDAKDYVKSLKAEAEALKAALRREKLGPLVAGNGTESNALAGDQFGGIATYIAARQGDLKSLTEGISTEIVDAMKLLVDFVLEGGGKNAGKPIRKEEMQMEIPGSALQQLALWQLILGYRLREAEAKGDYLKLLE